MPTPLRRPRAIVFDFDGTLSRQTIDFNHMRHRLGDIASEYFPVPPEPDGLPALEWIASLCARLMHEQPSLALSLHQRCYALIEEIEMEAAQRGTLFESTKPLLRDLATAGIRTAIITRNCARAVSLIFPDAEDYVERLLTRDHVPRVKPDPHHLRQAIIMLGCTPWQTIMVGDHPMDIATGKQAGTLTAAVVCGETSRETLLALQPDFVAPDCPALIRLLQQRALLP